MNHSFEGILEGLTISVDSELMQENSSSFTSLLRKIDSRHPKNVKTMSSIRITDFSCVE